MKTVKELKQLLEKIPEETPLLVKFYISDFDWTYFQNVDVFFQPMTQIEKSDEWKYDSKGQLSLIIN